MPTLDIVIVNWNTGPYLRRCLDSIERAASGPFELADVIVVDNASTDRSLEEAAASTMPVRLMENDSNLGFAAACNQGAAAGTADHLLFLNPDAELSATTLVEMGRCMGDASNMIGVVGAQMRTAEGTEVSSCSRFPTPRALVVETLGLHRLAPLRFTGRHIEIDEMATSGPVDQVIGACFLTRRELFDALGGFDERFFVYYEEVDFCLRARQHGWSTYHCHEAAVTHAGSVSAGATDDAGVFYNRRSRTEYARKHWEPRTATFVAAWTLLVEFPLRLIKGTLNRRVAGIAQAWRRYGAYVRGVG